MNIFRKATPTKVFAPTGNKPKPLPAKVPIIPVNVASKATKLEIQEFSSNFVATPTVRFQIDEIDSSTINTSFIEGPLMQSERVFQSVSSFMGDDQSSSSQPALPNLAPSSKPVKKQSSSNSRPKADIKRTAVSKAVSRNIDIRVDDEQTKASVPRKRNKKRQAAEVEVVEDGADNKEELLPRKRKTKSTKSSASAIEKPSRFSIFPTSYGIIHSYGKHSLYVKVVGNGSGIEGITLANMENRAVVSAVSEQYIGSTSVQINDVVYAVNHLDARYSTFDQIMKALTRAPQTVEAYYDSMGYQRSALDIGSGGNRVALKHAVVDSIAKVVFARAIATIVEPFP